MIFESLCVGHMGVNCYILASAEGKKAMIIDPGSDYNKIRRVMDKHKLEPGLIINTHGHYDHIGCDDRFGAPVYIHKDDERLLYEPSLNLSGIFFVPYKVNSKVIVIEDGQEIALDDIRLKAIHVPGHTPGGIALLMLSPKTDILFSGDILFYRGIGRSDLGGGSQEQLISSIKEKIITLNPDTVVYPGHGQSTTIKDEIENNQFLM